MIILSSTTVKMAVTTACPCLRVIKRSKVQIGSRNFNLTKKHLVVQRGAGWNLLETLNSSEIRNMVAHLDVKEIRVLKALHKAPLPKPFIDSAADSNADTAEAYCPLRISDSAARMGLKAEFALNDGKAWDLPDAQMQRQALEKLPMALGCVVSLHTIVSVTTLELLNVEPQQRLRSIADGLKHLAFAVVLCLEQAAAGRKFAPKHPAKASVCESEILKVLKRQAGAPMVNLGRCMMGLTSRDSLGAAFAREITSIATDSNGFTLELHMFQFDGTHGHGPTDREKVKQRQVHPEALCEVVCVTTV